MKDRHLRQMIPQRQGWWRPYLATAAMVTVLFLTTMLRCGLYPFGDGALASSDANNQYLNFYSYFRDTFFSNNDLSYSFSTVLGGNIHGLYAYYLSSPLYLLLVLFPEKQLLLALHLIIYLKFLTAALCFCAWAGYRKKGNPWMRAALSVSYAFIGYNVTFYSLLSWLDAAALLPLVALGLERLVRERKPLVYIISLAVTIMANYYVGFMVCLASVLFYAALLFTDPEGPVRTGKRTFLRFGLSSLLAASLSAWTLLPTVCALPGSRLQEMGNLLDGARSNFPFLSFFSKLFTGTTSADQFYNGLPSVFVGIIPLMLAVLFFLNPGIRRRWKVVAGGAVLVLFFSFHNSFLNIVWHGFTQNRMFNYRYSFVFSFLLLAIAWHCVLHWKTLPAGAFTRCAAILLGGTLLVFNTQYEYGSISTLYFDLALMALGLALTLYAVRGRRFAAGALACLMAVNCFANASLSINNIRDKFGSALQSERTGFLSKVESALDLIPEDGSFYRVEKTFNQTPCDNMSLNLPGATNFSSVEQEPAMAFIWSLGLNRFIAWGNYTGDNPVSSESLLGIRYILSQEPLGPGREAYDLTGTAGDISVYENPYALPMVMPGATLLPTLEEHDGFLFQNACWRSLAPEVGQDIFTRAPRLEIRAPEEGNTWYFTYEMPMGGNAYLHFPGLYSAEERPFTVKLLREDGQEPETLRMTIFQSTFPLGTRAQGEKLTLEVTFKSAPKPEDLERFLVYAEDGEALAAYSQAVRNTPVQIEKITSSHLRVQCRVGADTPYLVSTIPYDEGWTVTVDGARIPCLKNWNCMLAFAVEPGAHTIELRYHPPGRTGGLAITGIGAAILILGIAVEKKRKKDRSTAGASGALPSEEENANHAAEAR